MTEEQRATRSAGVAKLAVASLMISGAALALAGQATAEPVEPLPPPAPGAPVAPPPVPEMANPAYGQGNSGSSLGYLGDIWRAARSGDPYGALAAGPQGAPAQPPAGAGPAPALPPGFVSITDPNSTTAPPQERSSADVQPGGPPLPEGYYPLSGPPPPGYFDNSTQPVFGAGAPAPGQPVSPAPAVP